MKITKVELQNWGPFFGKVDFDMGSREMTNKPLTVIHAKNGHGKTSILRALKWVIVGGKDGKVKIGPNINWKAFIGTEKFETSVTLFFRRGDDEYVLKRFLEYDPTAKKTMDPRELKLFTEKMEDKSRLSLQPGNRVPFTDDAAEQTLATLFPPRLANFYFFDAADLLVQYDQVEMGKNSKAASLLGSVESALGFSGLDTMVVVVKDMLEEAWKELEKQGKNNKKANQLAEEIADLKKTIETKKVDKEKLVEQLESANQKIDLVEAQMEGNEKNRELQLKRVELRKKISDNTSVMDSCVSDIATKLEDLWQAPMRGRLEELTEQVSEDRAKYESVLASKNALDLKIANIESQLETKNCNSCGNSLNEQELERNRSELEQANKELTNLESQLQEHGSKEFAQFDSALSELWGTQQKTELSDVLNSENMRSKASTDVADAKQDLHALQSKLDAIDDVDYIGLNQQYKELANVIAQGKLDLGLVEDKLRELENDLNSKRNQHAKLNPQAKLAAKRAEHLEHLVKSLEKVQSQLKTEVRKQIETKANEVLEELKTPLDGSFALHIDDNYDLDTDRPQPNAGFKQTLFLSFLFAIPLVAKAPFPLVMDSPLQHIDADHYEKFVQYCKTGVEQLVLLPHDKEIKEGDVKEVFGDQLSNLYVITHDPSEGISDIEKRG